MRIFLQSFQEVTIRYPPSIHPSIHSSILSFNHPKRERATGSLQFCWRSRKNCGFAPISNASLRAFANSSITTTTTTQFLPKLPAGVLLQLPALPSTLTLDHIEVLVFLRLGFYSRRSQSRKSHSLFVLTVPLRFQFWLLGSRTLAPVTRHQEEVQHREKAICIVYSRSHVHIRLITFPVGYYPRLGWLGGSPVATSSPVPSRPVFSGCPAAAPCRVEASKGASSS